MRVLVVEDERRLADAIARGLRREGMAVDICAGRGGRDREERTSFGTTWWCSTAICRRSTAIGSARSCVSRSRRPSIIMLTAASETEELVAGLALGADDYLAKPFRFEELVARIRALGRRAVPSRPTDSAPLGIWSSTPARRSLTRGGDPVELARKELAVLEALMSADGATVSAEELLERVWDEHTDPFTNVVRMTIMTLRRKLGDPPIVETVIGVGYRMA
jgi:DNA-binding response OmpR family regulator